MRTADKSLRPLKNSAKTQPLLSACYQWATLQSYLTLSTDSLAKTMAPASKYPCPCFRCHSRKQLARRTIQIHYKDNLSHLHQLMASGADQDSVKFVQDCHYEITQLLKDLAEESQSSRQSESSYPEGEYLPLFCL